MDVAERRADGSGGGSAPPPAVHAVSPDELADLELLLTGALAPARFVLPEATGAAGLEPVLTVPAEVADGAVAAGALLLGDPEGLPLARLEVSGRVPAGPEAAVLAGPVTPLADPAYGAFRSLARRPAEVRAGWAAAPAPVPGVPVDRPLLAADLDAVRDLAAAAGRVLLLVRTAGPAGGLPPETLVRTTLAAVAGVPGVTVVTVPLRRLPDPGADGRAVAQVAAAYGVTDVHPLASPARWDQVRAALDAGTGADPDGVPAPVLAELRRWRPPRAERGVVVFFTGLSGAGKSTVARAFVDLLAEHSTRRHTLLDGDVVRRMLSAGLGFSRADRDLNVRRIGWVAAELARHGALAVCAPIAPYAATRAEVRAMVTAAGGDFLLVHMATPLEVCEQRDVKGLYRAAREGRITAMTGVDDPYEAPRDAELTLDSSSGTAGELAARVLALLTEGGWLAR